MNLSSLHQYKHVWKLMFATEICNIELCQQMQSLFPPVQIVLPLIVSIMELAIDEALPLALLPGVDGQVVEAKQAALVLSCA